MEKQYTYKEMNEARKNIKFSSKEKDSKGIDFVKHYKKNKKLYMETAKDLLKMKMTD